MHHIIWARPWSNSTIITKISPCSCSLKILFEQGKINVQRTLGKICIWNHFYGKWFLFVFQQNGVHSLFLFLFFTMMAFTYCQPPLFQCLSSHFLLMITPWFQRFPEITQSSFINNNSKEDRNTSEFCQQYILVISASVLFSSILPIHLYIITQINCSWNVINIICQSPPPTAPAYAVTTWDVSINSITNNRMMRIKDSNTSISWANNFTLF